MSPAEIAAEVSRYPLTGRFLMGRLRHALSEREKALLEGVIARDERFSTPHTVLERGDVVEASTMLVEGMAARVIRRGSDRHIVGLHVPGDFVDLHGFALKRLDHDIVTLGPARVAYAPHERLSTLLRNEPHLARLLWFASLLDAAIHREWILALERLTADARVAHLLAETWRRLDFVGLAGSEGYDLPLNQIELANACGTTTVHMNRTVRGLRESGIVEFPRGRIVVPDRARLEALAGFDPSYLYGKGALSVGDALSRD